MDYKIWVHLNSLASIKCSAVKVSPISSDIIESVDSISRDGPDTPIILYIIHYKKPNNSITVNFQAF